MSSLLMNRMRSVNSILLLTTLLLSCSGDVFAANSDSNLQPSTAWRVDESIAGFELFVVVNIGDEIPSHVRKAFDAEDTVYVDPATLNVYFSNSYVSDAAGMTIDSSGVYHSRNLGLYSNFAKIARARALKEHPESKWVGASVARAAAKKTRLETESRVRAEQSTQQKYQNSKQGYDLVKSSIFDSSGSMVGQHRYHPAEALVGRKFIVIPLNRREYSTSSKGVFIDPDYFEKNSLERRLIEFEESGVLHCWSKNGKQSVSYYIEGEYADALLGVRLDEPLVGLGGITLGVSLINVPNAESENVQGDTGASRRGNGRRHPLGDRSERSGLAVQKDLADTLLVLTDGRIDGSNMAKTKFYGFLSPVEEGRFAALIEEQSVIGEGIKNASSTDFAEEISIPSWAEYNKDKWGPSREKAIWVLRQAYAGKFEVKDQFNIDSVPEENLFVGFQKAWLELNPNPNEPMSFWNYTANGYRVTNGWGTIVDQQEPIDKDIVVRTKYSDVVDRVYKNGGGADRRYEPIAKMFYSVYPPGSPTANRIEENIYSALKN